MIRHERNELDKNWTWYLFFSANILIILGVAISWIMLKDANDISPITWFIPTLVCNILSLILSGFFVFYESKNITSIYPHINKKWVKFFAASLVFYIILVITSFVFFMLKAEMDTNLLFIIDFSICVFISLIAIALNRYSRFKMDLDIYRRKRGQKAQEISTIKKIKKETSKLSDEKFIVEKSKLDKDNEFIKSATSGLIDNVEKE